MMAKNVLTQNLSESLGGATSARFDINAGDGNLMIDGLTGDEQVLASGTLQYMENQGLPIQSVDTNNGQATLTLKASRAKRPWLHLPWDVCNGATEWQIHLNPNVKSDLTAHCDGGNVNLNLAGMAITRVSADTGGGNMSLVLPEDAANIGATARSGGGNVTVEIGSGITGNNTVTATSGAGNVFVHLPDGIAALIHATSGMGKKIVDSRFNKIDANTYQSPDYDRAADRVEIDIKSGAGNVGVNILTQSRVAEKV